MLFITFTIQTTNFVSPKRFGRIDKDCFVHHKS